MGRSIVGARAWFLPAKRDAAFFMVGVMGFFVGRFVVLGSMNPVAISFVANFLGSAHFYIAAPLALLGISTLAGGGFLVKYVISFGLLLAFNISQRKTSNIYMKSVLAALAALIGGLSLAVFEASIYLAVMAVMEAVMTLFLTYILKMGTDIVLGKRKRKLLTGEEAVSIAVLTGAVVAGMVDIYIGDVALRLFVASFVILTAAHRGGVALGATVGVVIGLALHLAGYQSASLALIMAAGGLSAGLLHKRPKPYAFASMAVVSIALAAYLDPSYITQTLLLSGLSGGLLFLITPTSFYFNVNSSLNPALDNSEEYLHRVRTMASDRLSAFAEAFGKLSASFSSIGEKRTTLAHNDIGTLIDELNQKSCEGCTMHQFCWQANFYDTYQSLFAMLSVCESKGRLELRDLPEAFRETCINQPRFLDTLNRLFELYKLNLAWNNKILDSRELVAQQLGGVSSLVRSLSRDMGLEMRFKEDLEQAITRELSSARIEAESVIVLENKQGILEVSISYRPPLQNQRTSKTKEISAIVSRALGKRMVSQGEPTLRKGFLRLSLREEQHYRITTGLARATKSLSQESGDNYSVLQLKNGNAVLALSDGMGSGKKANNESTTAIELLEDLLESGFETEMAIRMINSALVLKSAEDSFSTLDICSINLYSGEAEFCKISASPTFILRSASVSSVRSNSLPIGILNNIDMEISSRQLRSADVIIMVTDGVCDPTGKTPHGDWIAQHLPALAGKNPQDIADTILDEARQRAGFSIRDDMTVLTIRIMSKEG